jgi:DNA-binding transcriptional MerR regulator
MPDVYTTQDVARLFQVSRQTVKNWSDEFVSYLSPTAQPEKGKKKLFTPEDIEVFALVAEYHGRGLHYEDVHAALKTGQKGIAPLEQRGLSPLQPSELMVALKQQVDELHRMNEELKSERDEERGKVKLLRRLLTEKDEVIYSLYQKLANPKRDTS